MIPAFIVLVVIAFALGGYIGFDILHRGQKDVSAIVIEPEQAQADSPTSMERSVIMRKNDN